MSEKKKEYCDLNKEQVVVQTGEEVVEMANSFENVGYRVAFYEEYLTNTVVISKAWLKEVMSSTGSLTDLRWWIKTKLLGEAKEKWVCVVCGLRYFTNVGHCNGSYVEGICGGNLKAIE